MSDYIEQMGKAVRQNLSPETRMFIAWSDWDELPPEHQITWINAIKTAFQSLWIDIAEHGLPEEGKTVWFCEEDGKIHRGSYEGDGAWWDEDELELISANVTHWMPMAPPPPPKRYSNCK